jgi:membrane protein implicated in regulation of membrane protease activity
MATKFVSRQNVLVVLGVVMIICLALTIVTFAVALIWIGRPLGNAAVLTADAFASVFSVALFAAFALAMAEHQWRSERPPKDGSPPPSPPEQT